MVFQSSIGILFFTLYLVYQVNCYKSSLDANIWVPSFESYDNDKSYLKQKNNNNNNFDYNPYAAFSGLYGGDNDDDDDDNEAINTDSDESSLFGNNDDLQRYKDIFSKSSLSLRDYNTGDLDDLFASPSDDDIFNNARDHESESHSSLVGGYQFVSGGAGEGKQHLNPEGDIPNKAEIKSDIDLPAYCDPPNPCPVGYKGDDCDRTPYKYFTAEYSKEYQSKQNCICDSDHNECSKSSASKQKSNKNGAEDKIQDLLNKMSIKDQYNVVAKKSPRAKRDASSHHAKGAPKTNLNDKLTFHVAKKSPHI